MSYRKDFCIILYFITHTLLALKKTIVKITFGTAILIQGRIGSHRNISVLFLILFLLKMPIHIFPGPSQKHTRPKLSSKYFFANKNFLTLFYQHFFFRLCHIGTGQKFTTMNVSLTTLTMFKIS